MTETAEERRRAGQVVSCPLCGREFPTVVGLDGETMTCRCDGSWIVRGEKAAPIKTCPICEWAAPDCTCAGDQAVVAGVAGEGSTQDVILRRADHVTDSCTAASVPAEEYYRVLAQRDALAAKVIDFAKPRSETPVRLDIPVIKETGTRVINDDRGFRRYVIVQIEVLDKHHLALTQTLAAFAAVPEKGEVTK